MNNDEDPEDWMWERPSPPLHPRREAFTKMLAAIVVFTLIALGIKWLWH